MNTSRFLIALGVILCLVLSPVIALVPADTTQAQPADSAWPMFHQNPQHTGRSPYSCPAGTPYEKWSVQTNNGVWSSPAIGADGTIYVGSNDGCLYAINPDGTPMWKFTTLDLVRSSPAIGADGTIYVGSWDGNFYAINPDKTEKWRFPAGKYKFEGSPTIGTDGTIYVVCEDGKLYAINPADGSEKWNSLQGIHFASSPAIGADGTIYFGSYNGSLCALNPDDGSPKWSSPLLGGLSSPAIGADGTIYARSFDNKLYAINPDDGSPKWISPIGTIGGLGSSSPAIGADGTIYVGFDYKLYAINPDDGSPKWSSPSTGHYIYSSPAIGADGTIYFGSYNGNLCALNPADGSMRWTFPTGNAIFSSPAIGDDGTVYVGSTNGKLYAITGVYTLTIPPPLITAALPGHVTDPGWGTFIYEGGTVVKIVAEAAEGFRFVEWTGDVGTIADVNAASTIIKMEGDYEIAARFEEAGGCFIATAAYGTPMAEEIETLREFRDEYLLTNPVGQVLVDLYYRVSPPVAEFITEHPSLKSVVRAGLVPALAMSAVAVNTTPAEKMAVVGLLVLVSAAVTVWATRRRGRGPQYT
jgi:outer membrane protein assembly factor BamB